MSRHGIHQMGLKTRPGQQQCLVLRMNVHQPVGDSPQCVQRHRCIGNKCPALPRCGNHPPHGNHLFPVQVVFFENGLQVILIRRHVELAFDHTGVLAVPDHRGIGPRPAQQRQRPQKDRFPGPRLPGDDVQPRMEVDVEVADNGVVFYVQMFQHISANFRVI